MGVGKSTPVKEGEAAPVIPIQPIPSIEDVVAEEKQVNEEEKHRRRMVMEYAKTLKHFAKEDPVMFEELKENIRLLMLDETVRTDEEGVAIIPTKSEEEVVKYFKMTILPHIKEKCRLNENDVLNVTLTDFSDDSSPKNKEDDIGFGVGFFIFQLACHSSTPINIINVHRGKTSRKTLDACERTVLFMIFQMRWLGVREIKFDDKVVWDFVVEAGKLERMFNVPFLHKLIYCTSTRKAKNYMKDVEIVDDKMTILVTINE